MDQSKDLFIKNLLKVVWPPLLLIVAIFLFSKLSYFEKKTIESHKEDPRPIVDTLEMHKNLKVKPKYAISSSTPQFVLLSFDGSKSVPMLNETLDFARKMNANGKPLHFTYFINAAYFLTGENASIYQGPGKMRGFSNIGFSDSVTDIRDRVAGFNSAILEGHEVGSHAVGHFNGQYWSYGEWYKEFKDFEDLLNNVAKNNPGHDIGPVQFLANHMTGFRAPDLGVNENLYRVLKDSGFKYDASGVGNAEEWPHKDNNGLWHIPLGTIRIGKGRQPALAMDYSLWMHQSGAVDEVKKDSLKWQEYKNDITTAYEEYFDTNYVGGRAPVVIANHFSKWNDGLYWEAMKDFAEYACGKPQVRCVTFKSFVDYLNENGIPSLISLNKTIHK